MTRPDSVGGDERLRLFLALRLPEDVLDQIVRWQRHELPGSVRDELTRATARPLSPAGVAGLRLGLSFRP